MIFVPPGAEKCPLHKVKVRWESGPFLTLKFSCEGMGQLFGHGIIVTQPLIGSGLGLEAVVTSFALIFTEVTSNFFQIWAEIYPNLSFLESSRSQELS